MMSSPLPSTPTACVISSTLTGNLSRPETWRAISSAGGWTKISAPHRALLIQPFVDSVPMLLKLEIVFWRVGNLIEVVILDEHESFGVFGITQELFQFVTVIVHKIFFY